jgi:hypothetical protein
MNSIQIKNYMQRQNNTNIFKGVFASDSLPDSFSLPAGFIVNLSPSTSPGSHWISIYIDSNKNCEYFDSFGFQPKEIEIIKFMKKHSKIIKPVDIQLQHLMSKNCGKYATVFLVWRMKNKNTANFIQLFNKNLFLNEKLIEKYYKYFLK